jgi:hypothetical protein
MDKTHIYIYIYIIIYIYIYILISMTEYFNIYIDIYYPHLTPVIDCPRFPTPGILRNHFPSPDDSAGRTSAPRGPVAQRRDPSVHLQVVCSHFPNFGCGHL